jgi:BlaI family penicillinase repressor
MARPPSTQPTPAELEALHILWERGPSTVREVMDTMSRHLAYTTVLTLLNVMHEKKLVTRKPEGRAFRYAARFEPDQTQRSMLADLLDRAFDGSANLLVARLLEQTNPSPEELSAIHKRIADYKRRMKSQEPNP